MQFSIVFLSVLILIVSLFEAQGSPQPEEDPKYTSKYDNLDLDQILKNDRLLNNYVKCLLEKGKCTPDGAELKTVLPDALKTECSKCNPTQKERSEKVIRYLAQNKKNHWDDLVAKYDPTGEFKDNYAKFAEKKGISI